MNRGNLMDAFDVSVNPTSTNLNRWIAPHAIGFDGFRWHTRAFCLTDHNFKDSLLLRIIETRETHPVKALDYNMRDGKAKTAVRRALICYARKRLGLDTDPAARRPQKQQIVPLNREMLGAWTAAQNSTSRMEG